MSISLPTDIPLISDEQLRSLQDCFEVREGYLYFHRIQDPTRGTVYHGVDLLNRHLQETGYRIILFDFTNREMMDHAHMRYLVEQIKDSKLMKAVEHCLLVLDGNPFRRVAASFFLSTFYRNQSTNVHMYQTLADAEAVAEQIVSNSRGQKQEKMR